MEESPIIDIEVKAVHWLRGFPSTVIIDRLEFILNRVDFRARIDAQVAQWPILELPKLNRMFVICIQNVWHRAVIKFFDDRTNKCVLQLVDSSKTVDFRRNQYQIRLIEDPIINEEPWGRYKCYLFGIQFKKTPFSAEMVEMFDNFFGNCQLRAVMLPIQQHSEHMRKTYLCDFIKTTPDGPQSFRKLVLGTDYATEEHKDGYVNIRLNRFVQNILAQKNAYELDPTLRSIISSHQWSTSHSTTTLRPCSTSHTTTTLRPRTLITTEILQAPSTHNELESITFSKMPMLTIHDIVNSPEISEHISISPKRKNIGKGAVRFVCLKLVISEVYFS